MVKRAHWTLPQLKKIKDRSKEASLRLDTPLWNPYIKLGSSFESHNLTKSARSDAVTNKLPQEEAVVEGLARVSHLKLACVEKDEASQVKASHSLGVTVFTRHWREREGKSILLGRHLDNSTHQTHLEYFTQQSFWKLYSADILKTLLAYILIT